MVGRRSGCFHGSEFNRKYDGQMDTNLRGGGCTKKGSETADMEMTEMLLKRAALRGEGGRRANKNTIVGVPEGGGDGRGRPLVASSFIRSASKSPRKPQRSGASNIITLDFVSGRSKVRQGPQQPTQGASYQGCRPNRPRTSDSDLRSPLQCVGKVPWHIT